LPETFGHSTLGPVALAAPRIGAKADDEPINHNWRIDVMSGPDPKTKIDEMNAHIEQFKQMSYRAKERIERLAELSFTIEDELKMKDFADRVSDLFTISTQFEEKLEALINDFEIERNRIANEEV
jgi:hypothetical protein